MSLLKTCHICRKSTLFSGRSHGNDEKTARLRRAVYASFLLLPITVWTFDKYVVSSIFVASAFCSTQLYHVVGILAVFVVQSSVYLLRSV